MATPKDIRKLRTWIEIDTKALAHNFGLFRWFIGVKTQLMAVVKSNAYGHGLVETSQVFSRLGADWLGVDSITEALVLRQAGIKTPMLVLGYTLAFHFDEAAKKDVTLTVSQLESIRELVAWSKKPGKAELRVHLKVDTGMHRQGFWSGDFERSLEELAKAKRVVVTGLYSHLAGSGGNRAFRDQTLKQAEEFLRFKVITERKGLKLFSHLTASGGALAYPEYHFDMVRIGAGLYGLWPSAEVKDRRIAEMDLKPALSWKTIVGEVKVLSETSAVGYDFTQTVPRGTKLAVCPVGYWHGFSTHLSSKGNVVIRGKIVPVVGRVSMDMIVVDVTSLPEVGVGDEVILLGDKISAADIAAQTGETLREPSTRLNPLIWRQYL